MVINNGRVTPQRPRLAPAANTELRVVAWPSRSHTRHTVISRLVFLRRAPTNIILPLNILITRRYRAAKSHSPGEITQVFSVKSPCLRPRQTLCHVRERHEGIIAIRFLYPVTYIHVNVPSNVSSSQRRTIRAAHLIPLHHANVPLEAVR